jgi:hypothetical protein
MSTQTFPCRSFEIDEALIAKLCPTNFKRFKGQLEIAGTYPDWINAHEDGDIAEFPHPEGFTSLQWYKHVKYWYTRLCNQFKKKTGLPLTLWQWREDSVVGNNDVPARPDGCYWATDLNAVMIYSPAAKKLQKYLHELEWVECG